YVGADTNGTLPGDNTLGPDLVDKDLTIEFWLRWDAAPSTSSVEIGLRSGAKLRITRDTVTPANDQFAIFATHGTFVSAPGFTNWDAVGTEEAPLAEWIHVAVAIDSTGSTFDVPTGHHKYNPGTVARFYLNGHAVGSAPHTVPLDGTLDFHSESSLLTIRNLSGSVTIDEVAIWSADLSVGGTVVSPFSNGRGVGVSSISDWSTFE
ncbi:MAG: LamG-like jellyroll fold domain-containing protein, partial [Candidatus Sumerlaeia bacterium]|nr:LamG-like jellyroll fold domain-containing protein [Candidatus Sumerlaeia bacterium]